MAESAATPAFIDPNVEACSVALSSETIGLDTSSLETEPDPLVDTESGAELSMPSAREPFQMPARERRANASKARCEVASLVDSESLSMRREASDSMRSGITLELDSDETKTLAAFMGAAAKRMGDAGADADPNADCEVETKAEAAETESPTS